MRRTSSISNSVTLIVLCTLCVMAKPSDADAKGAAKPAARDTTPPKIV